MNKNGFSRCADIYIGRLRESLLSDEFSWAMTLSICPSRIR